MNPYGSGLHLNRAHFDETLREAVRGLCHRSSETSRPCLFRRGKCVATIFDQNGWDVRVEEANQQTVNYRCSWLIDATGRKAFVASKVRTGYLN